MAVGVDSTPVAAVIVLAAGSGTRMKSTTSKLLHEVAGHSMLSWAVGAADAVGPDMLCVVVGHAREQVTEHLTTVAPHARVAVQEEQNGTGHAVQCALAELGELTGDVVVTYGDVPLLSGETLSELVAAHRSLENAVTVLTADHPSPTGYGRIVRDEAGTVERIVEQKDATPEEQAITEINSGIYVFDAQVLADGLRRITSDNAQAELYLTDVLGIARGDGRRVGAHRIDDLWQTEGVNDRVQLARMDAEINRRILEAWMRAGVTIINPDSVRIDRDVDLAQDVTLLPGTHLEGATTVGDGATIGPETTLTDVEVGAGATITRSVGKLAVVGPGATVGPFAYLRPGTRIGTAGKVGTFVETKNTTVGDGAKVPHLTYAGDADIAAGANIGAGTIFANFDGVGKHRTYVGENSFVGSNSVLVAPVRIEDGTYVAAGSAITVDVAPGDLGVARGRQRNIPGWVAKRRAGTGTAESAASHSRGSDVDHAGDSATNEQDQA